MQDESPDAVDARLRQRAVNGSSQAFHELVDRHADRLFRLAVSLVGGVPDAEDVLQETFLGAFRGLEKFEARSSVKTWLTKILVRQAALRRRQNRRSKTEPLASESAERPHREIEEIGATERSGRKIDLMAALQMLSAEHREILSLREFEQLSYEEIADVLQVSRGTVESRLYRARAELRNALQAYSP